MAKEVWIIIFTKDCGDTFYWNGIKPIKELYRAQAYRCYDDALLDAWPVRDPNNIRWQTGITWPIATDLKERGFTNAKPMRLK